MGGQFHLQTVYLSSWLYSAHTRGKHQISSYQPSNMLVLFCCGPIQAPSMRPRTYLQRTPLSASFARTQSIVLNTNQSTRHSLTPKPYFHLLSGITDHSPSHPLFIRVASIRVCCAAKAAWLGVTGGPIPVMSKAQDTLRFLSFSFFA